MPFTIIRHSALNGQAVTRETQVAGTSLDIGRGTGNALVLDDLHIALRHAVIEYVDGRYVIKDLETKNSTYVNYRSVRMRLLADGDVVHIGSYSLLMRLPAGDAPLTIEVTRQGREASADGPEPIAYLARYRLSESFLTKGRLTVWGLVLVLGGATVFLLLGDVSLGKKTWHTSALLAPGDVTPSHRFIGHQCAQCHAEGWSAPSTTACTTCHASPRHHADEAFTPACASCHREHRSDHKALISIGDRFCVHCHAALPTVEGRASQFASQIRGFDDGHPEFSVTVQAPHEQTPTRVKLSDKAALRDTTAMRLNHAVHLTPERMQRLGLKALTCTNCHKLENLGASMVPIAYGAHCQQCHPLEFDDRFPQQAVPHGEQPEKIQEFLRKIFRDSCLDRLAQSASSSQTGGEGPQERRLPGQSESREETTRAVSCTEEGAREAREAQRRLYAAGKQSVCGYCHTLQDPPPGGPLPTVSQPAIPARWFPHSAFDHQVHLRAAKRSTSESTNPCESCHSPDVAASKSQQTSDVLLPGIASCQECHSSAGGASQLCVTCHTYHASSARQPSY